MDEKEHDELLYRLDERMERIEDEHIRRLSNLESRVGENAGHIQQLDDTVQKHDTILKIMTGGLGSIIAGIGVKVGGLFSAIRAVL